MSYTNLVYMEEQGLHFLESARVPEEALNAVKLLIAKAQSRNSRIKPDLLDIAREITTKYPTYLSGNYAAASLIVAGAAKYEKAFEPLYRTWMVGERAIKGHGVHQLRFSLTPENAHFLDAGTDLATYYVWKGRLDVGLQIIEQVIALDVENATSARFVQAHIHHLMGTNLAFEALKAIACEENPLAYYALGLEQLRRQMFKEARISFSNGFMFAPAVASILLNREELNNETARVREREAAGYVETFCLSEWTVSELSILDSCIAQGQLTFAFDEG